MLNKKKKHLKFQLLVALGHMPRRVWSKIKNVKCFAIVQDFFPFRKHMGPYVGNSFKTLLDPPSNRFCIFPNSWNFFSVVFTEVFIGLRILSFRFSRFFFLFSSAWLCQQSSWNRNSSVVRPSVAQLSLNPMHGFFQILVVASPGPYSRACLAFLKKKNEFHDFFQCLKFQNSKTFFFFCEDHWEENWGKVWKLSAAICRRSGVLTSPGPYA